MSSSESPTQDQRQFNLKPLSKEGVEAAIEKAEKYRLLNDPLMAESICLDILEIEPGNERTLSILILALTDQFGKGSPNNGERARELAGRFNDEYNQVYYLGLIHERQGTASLNSNVPGGQYDAYEWYREAMDLYEKAQAIHPTGNDDAILRWNTCARIIMHQNLEPRPEDDSINMLE